MKKPLIAFTALVIAAGSSVGAYYAVKDKKKTEDKKAAEAQDALVLFDFDPKSINKMEFSTHDGKYTAELSDDETWKLTSGSDFLLEQEYINLICEYASELTASDSYEGDPASYGLDDPQTVTLSNDTDSYTINVGDLSPTKEFYYVSVGGNSKIYAVPALSGSYLDLQRSALITKSIIPYISTSDIKAVKLIKNGKVTCQLDFDETNGWHLPPEYDQFSFDASKVQSMLAVMTHIIVQDVLEEDPDDLSKYDLDKPYGEAVITGSDGVDHRILISKPTQNKDYCNILLCNYNNQVELVYTSDMDFIDYTPFDFTSQTRYNPDFTTIKGFELDFEGRKDSVTIDNESKKCSFNGTEFNLNIDTQLSDFFNFYNALSNLYLSNIDIESKPEMKDPILTAVYHLSDGTDMTYQLCDAGNDQCNIFIDGKFTGELMDKSSLTGKNSLSYFRTEFINSINAE